MQLIPAGLLLIGAFWIKESPRWLLSKHRRDEALNNLSWIRKLPADDLYMIEEVASLDHVLEAQAAAIGEGFFQPFKAAARDRKVQWRLFLGSIMFMWQNGSGINAINYYSPRVFASIGIRGTSTSFLTTGIFGVVKTVMTVVWILVLIDHLGRRKLLMIGAGGGAICMFIIGAYILHNPVDPNSDNNHSTSKVVQFNNLSYYTPTCTGCLYTHCVMYWRHARYNFPWQQHPIGSGTSSSPASRSRCSTLWAPLAAVSTSSSPP